MLGYPNQLSRHDLTVNIHVASGVRYLDEYLESDEELGSYKHLSTRCGGLFVLDTADDYCPNPKPDLSNTTTMDDVEVQGTPWLTLPVQLHGYRDWTCGQNTTAECDYYHNYWHFWWVVEVVVA